MSTKILIELNTRRLTLKTVNTQSVFPVAIGKASTPTPTGDYKVLSMTKNPGGALGSRWIQFTPQQHGIHGTNQPSSIGQAVSNGCVRMYNHDVERVYGQIRINTPIIIRHRLSGQHSSSKHHNYFIHTVQSGESLYLIAKMYGSTVSKIMTLNNLRGTIIYPEQKLKITMN